jgi:tetratricopeptide (TPR) repeat protein
MAETGRVFLSHTHDDAPIAHAIRDLFTEIFQNGVSVHYSTSKETGGAPLAGEDWFKWIVEQVTSSDCTLVLLTPSSIHKPWILWEAGAVYGAAAAGAKGSINKVVPLVYQLSNSQVPSPIQSQRVQLTSGDNSEQMKRLMRQLLGREFFGESVPLELLVQAGERLNDALRKYMGAVTAALLNSPMPVTEPSVQEWLERIDDLADAGRASEIGEIHYWLNIAFGREPDQEDRTLDVRIHRRLGEAYFSAREYDKATTQFELAQQLAPRDLFVLRKLGAAQLSGNRLDAARETLERIGELDGQAFVRNVECAALKARWLEAQERFEEAAEVLSVASDRNPSSYYLADRLGQIQLAAGNVAAGQEAFRRALRIIDKMVERNVWTWATRATAQLATGDVDGTVESLRQALAQEPSGANVDSIRRGLEGLGRALKLDSATMAKVWVAFSGWPE